MGNYYSLVYDEFYANARELLRETSQNLFEWNCNLQLYHFI